MQRFVAPLLAGILVLFGLSACGSTQYILSTTTGTMLVSEGKPKLDATAGTYTLKDMEGKTTVVKKDDIVQIIER